MRLQLLANRTLPNIEGIGDLRRVVPFVKRRRAVPRDSDSAKLARRRSRLQSAYNDELISHSPIRFDSRHVVEQFGHVSTVVVAIIRIFKQSAIVERIFDTITILRLGVESHERCRASLFGLEFVERDCIVVSHSSTFHMATLSPSASRLQAFFRAILRLCRRSSHPRRDGCSRVRLSRPHCCQSQCRVHWG